MSSTDILKLIEEKNVKFLNSWLTPFRHIAIAMGWVHPPQCEALGWAVWCSRRVINGILSDWNFFSVQNGLRIFLRIRYTCLFRLPLVIVI